MKVFDMVEFSTEKMISVEEASKKMGLTKQTITRLIRQSVISAVRVGNKWVIDGDSLDDYMTHNNLIPEPADHPRSDGSLPEIVALSFFSGALGLDYGMELAGINPVLFCENDRKCRMTIQSMRPDTALIGDITKYDSISIRKMAGISEHQKIDVIFGGPPCQAFSTAGARRAFADSRGNVFLRYLDLVAELEPTYVVIENVRGLLSTPFPLKKDGLPVKGGALQIALNKLKESGYAVSFNLYNAANFGAPQIRERVVLIGKIGDHKVPYLTPTHSKDGSFGLPVWKTFGEAVADIQNDDMHFSSFPEKRLKYFRMLKEGQYWKDLPEDIQPEAMGKSFALSGGKTGFYRRITFSKPCPTLVTTPTMPATDLCHPTEDRPLSVEEYKRVQGFPDDWKICGNLSDMYKQIGNAVPIALGQAIGTAIVDDMNGDMPPRDFSDFPYSRYKRTNDMTWSVR